MTKALTTVLMALGVVALALFIAAQVGSAGGGGGAHCQVKTHNAYGTPLQTVNCP